MAARTARKGTGVIEKEQDDVTVTVSLAQANLSHVPGLSGGASDRGNRRTELREFYYRPDEKMEIKAALVTEATQMVAEGRRRLRLTEAKFTQAQVENEAAGWTVADAEFALEQAMRGYAEGG